MKSRLICIVTWRCLFFFLNLTNSQFFTKYLYPCRYKAVLATTLAASPQCMSSQLIGDFLAAKSGKETELWFLCAMRPQGMLGTRGMGSHRAKSLARSRGRRLGAGCRAWLAAEPSPGSAGSPALLGERLGMALLPDGEEMKAKGSGLGCRRAARAGLWRMASPRNAHGKAQQGHCSSVPAQDEQIWQQQWKSATTR